MPTPTPRADALCNDCGARTTHRTRSAAFASLQAHEDETGHMDQMYSGPAGWLRFKPLSWAGCVVSDGVSELARSLEADHE